MLTWTDKDDEYHYTRNYMANRGPILAGGVLHRYSKNPSEYFYYLLYGDGPVKCSSLAEGKKIVEESFRKRLEAANLIPREVLRWDYKTDIHTEHCCGLHNRCKYGKEESGCGVCDGTKWASYPCNCEHF